MSHSEPFFTTAHAAFSRMAEVGRTAFIVYTALLHHRNNKTGLCCPLVKTISEETGLSERSVHYALATLSERGWITIVHQYNNGSQVASQFTIHPFMGEASFTPHVARPATGCTRVVQPVAEGGCSQLQTEQEETLTRRKEQEEVIGQQSDCVLTPKQEKMLKAFEGYEQRRQSYRDGEYQAPVAMTADEENAAVDAWKEKVSQYAKYHDRTRKQYVDQALRIME